MDNDSSIRVVHNETISTEECRPCTANTDTDCHTGTVQFQISNRQEKTHSPSWSHNADKKYLAELEAKQDIAWPRMIDEKAWSDFQARVKVKLPPTGSVTSKLTALNQAEYEVRSSMFGHERVSKGFPYKTHKSKIINLVNTKNTFMQQLKEANSPVEAEGIKALLENTRIELRALRRKQNRQRKRWLKKKARNDFKRNPYQCGKDLLSPKCKVKPAFNSNDFNKFLQEQFSDPQRNDPLPTLDGLPDKPPIRHKFNGSAFKKRDYNKLMLSRRNGSRPGLNSIPYKVYKNAPFWRNIFLKFIVRSKELPMYLFIFVLHLPAIYLNQTIRTPVALLTFVKFLY